MNVDHFTGQETVLDDLPRAWQSEVKVYDRRLLLMTISGNVKGLRFPTELFSLGRISCATCHQLEYRQVLDSDSIEPPEAAGRSMLQLPRLIQLCVRRLRKCRKGRRLQSSPVTRKEDARILNSEFLLLRRCMARWQRSAVLRYFCVWPGRYVTKDLRGTLGRLGRL